MHTGKSVFIAGCSWVCHTKNQTCSSSTGELNTEYVLQRLVQWVRQARWLTEQGDTPSINV